MTDTEKAFVHLQSAYRVELDALQVEAYRRGLDDIDGQSLRDAVDRVIKAERHFPSVAVIRIMALDLQRERRRNEQYLIGDGTYTAPELSADEKAEIAKLIAATKAKLFGFGQPASREPGEEG